VIDAVSGILPVTSIQLRKNAIFKIGACFILTSVASWSESKIIVRLLDRMLVFALFALTTLKLRYL